MLQRFTVSVELMFMHAKSYHSDMLDLGHVYTYTFLRFALKTARASTLQCNQGKGRLQKGGFISTRMRNSYFNISLAWKRPFSLIVSEQVSVYSVYTKLKRCCFQKFPL